MNKNRTESEFVARKKVDSPFVNFVAFVFGIVTTLLLTFLLVFGVEQSPTIRSIFKQTSEGENFQFEKDNAQGHYHTILAEGSIEQLWELQEKLENVSADSSAAILIDTNLKRVEVANRLLQLPITAKLHSEVILAKMEAFSAIYGVDFLNRLDLPNLTHEWVETANEHLDSENPEVAKASHLALIKVRTFELIKANRTSEPVEADLQNLVERAIVLVNKFPEDTVQINSLYLVFYSLLAFEPDAGTDVVQQFIEKYDDPQSKPGTKLRQDCQDLLALTKSRFDQQYGNRELFEEKEKEAFAEMVRELVRDENGFGMVIRATAKGAGWLERNGSVDLARGIYQQLVDSAPHRKTKEHSSMALELGISGLTRCDLVGTHLKLHGVAINNLSDPVVLDPQAFSGKMVIVLFWSIRVEESLQQLVHLHRRTIDWAETNKTILAVCVDSELENTHATLMSRLPGYTYVSCHDSRIPRPTIMEQCPIQRPPYMLITDRQGIVRSLDIPLNDLPTEVELHSNR